MMMDEFRRIASRLKFRAPRIPIVSNVTGERATPEEITDASALLLGLAMNFAAPGVHEVLGLSAG